MRFVWLTSCRTAARVAAKSVNYTVIRNGGALPLLQIFRPRFKQGHT